MNPKLALVKIAPQEVFLRLSPAERLRQNDLMLNRVIEVEKFLGKIFRGLKFIKSHHGNLS